MTVLGLDPFRYLECTDPLERAIIVKLTNAAVEKYDEVLEGLATKIANKVSLLFSK